MGFLTGGSKSKSKNYNKAYDQLNNAYTPQVQTGTNASDFISRLLGLQGDTGQRAAFDTFRSNTGYDFLQNQAMKSVEGTMAGKGAYKSGATLKALQDRSAGIASQSYGSFLDSLFNLSQQGLAAGGLISGAGQVGESSSKSKGGLLPALANIGSKVAAGG